MAKTVAKKECVESACCSSCGCKPGAGILGLVLMTLGVYFLVWGFGIQNGSNISWTVWSWKAMLMYLVGIVLLMCGKMAKHKAMGQCCMHNH